MIPVTRYSSVRLTLPKSKLFPYFSFNEASAYDNMVCKSWLSYLYISMVGADVGHTQFKVSFQK